MMNITVGIIGLIIHHHLRLSGLHAVVLRTVLSHNRHSDWRLVGKMISVTRTRTAGAVGRELMDTRYRAGKMTSERREIHCRPSVEFMHLKIRKKHRHLSRALERCAMQNLLKQILRSRIERR